MDISGIEARISTIESRIDQISDLINPAAVSPTQFPDSLAAAQLGTPNSNEGETAPDGEPIRPVDPAELNITRPAAMTNSELDPIVNSASTKYGVDPQVVKAVIQTESSDDPTAVSSAGAEGLMQLMPSNIAESKVTDAFDPVQNIDAGVSQLSGYLKKYDGNLDQALAAYNAGPGAVEQFHGIPPYHETQEYIKKIRGLLDH
jgi:soluble lytic murein transglycosylase-like protein